jgi:hypothetical protein
MLEDKYRSCTDYREILRIFQKSSTMVDNFLWQTSEEGKNIIRPQHLEIDFVSKGITVYYDAWKYKVNSQLPLYVKLEHRNSVFKVNEFQVRQYSIHFSFPDMIKTIDLRSVPRIVLNPDRENYVTLRPTLTPLTQDVANEIRIRLVDVSRQGIGMMISENNRHFLKNNRFLWVMEMNGQRLDDPILAEVVYLTSEGIDQHRSKTRGKVRELKAGLKLSGEFPMEFFERITG